MLSVHFHSQLAKPLVDGFSRFISASIFVCCCFEFSELFVFCSEFASGISFVNSLLQQLRKLQIGCCWLSQHSIINYCGKSFVSNLGSLKGLSDVKLATRTSVVIPSAASKLSSRDIVDSLYAP